MAAVIRKKYDQHAVAELENYLLERAECGTPVRYKVLVDGRTVIPPTDDPFAFCNHVKFCNGNTQELAFCDFHGSSTNYEKTIFLFEDVLVPARNTSNSLAGLDSGMSREEEFEAMSKAIRLELENKQLAKEVAQYERHEAQYLERIKELEQELAEHKGSGKNLIGDIMKGFGGFVSTPGGFQQKMAGAGSTLAGASGGSGAQTNEDLAAQLDDQPTLSEEHQKAINTYAHLVDFFGKQRAGHLHDMVGLFKVYPDLIHPSLQTLQNRINKLNQSNYGTVSETNHHHSEQPQRSTAEGQGPERAGDL